MRTWRALGMSLPYVRQFRLTQNSKAYRTPTPGWEEALARLARERAKELKALADELERS
jgi:hypothetical protein